MSTATLPTEAELRAGLAALKDAPQVWIELSHRVHLVVAEYADRAPEDPPVRPDFADIGRLHFYATDVIGRLAETEHYARDILSELSRLEELVEREA